MNEPKLLSVIVVDDHPLFRRGVVELLNDSDNLRVIAEYDTGTELLANLSQAQPDILLLDLQMPDLSGIELLKRIRRNNEQLRIIIITACTDEDKLVEALRFGANGYLQKDTPPEDILSHLLAVADGKVALNQDALTSIASHLRNHQKQESKKYNKAVSELTDRERETLIFIAKGLNNKLIARQLGISDGTVKVYVKNLLRKLALNSRLELAAWAHKNLTDEDLS